MRLWLGLTVVLCGLVIVPAASAATYCVPSGTGCTPETTFANALTAAAGNSGRDTITLAASVTPYHQDSNTIIADVDIVGAGRGLTTIDRDNSPNAGFSTLPLSNSTASHLTVMTPNHNGTWGVWFGSGGSDSVTLNDVRVARTTPFTSTVSVEGDTDGTITGSTLEGERCLLTAGTADVTVDQTTFSSCETATYLTSTGTTNIRRSIFDGTAAFVTDGNARFDDSLFMADGGDGVDVEPGTGSAHPIVTINQSTITNDFPSDNIAVFVHEAGGMGADVHIFDTIIQGFDDAVLRQAESTASANVSLDNVSYDGAFDTATGNGPGAATFGTLFPAASFPFGFVNQEAGDFHLGSGSALRNRDSSPLRSGETLTTDLDGNPRFVDGARDIGAYEVQPQSPPPPNATAAVVSALKLSPKKVKHGKKGKLSYKLSQTVKVTFTATAKKHKKHHKPKTIKLGSQSGKAGSNSFKFSTKKLKKGKYTITVTPTGGSPKTISLTVK